MATGENMVPPPDRIELRDRFDRGFAYLRLSVTEACNFRCTYCLPDGYRRTAPHDFLTIDEIGRVARAFVAAGVTKIRLTGGEPSTRRDLRAIIAAVAATGVRKVALTTNGWALERDLDPWVTAGLTHLNVSIDSLDPRVFHRVTGHDRLSGILTGLRRAVEDPRLTVKVNAVLLRDTVDHGFEAFADFLREMPVAIRFIELMRTGDNAEFFADQHRGGQVLRDWIGARGWTPLPRKGDDGPAIEYVHPDFAGRFGLIAPYAPGFCDGCNRLRVTARGRLKLCLFGEGGVDLRDLLARDDQQAMLLARITGGLGDKRISHDLNAGRTGETRNLSLLGG